MGPMVRGNCVVGPAAPSSLLRAPRLYRPDAVRGVAVGTERLRPLPYRNETDGVVAVGLSTECDGRS